MRALLALLALAACNPYDPQLGDRPFLCGSDEPRCPDGYVAVDVSLSRCECRKSGSVADAGTYQCKTDPNEPNDGPAAATATNVGVNLQYNQPNVSICPMNGIADVDVYQLTAPRPSTLITVDVTFDTARLPPMVDILGPDGASVGPDVQSQTAGHIVATYTAAMAGGPYYARVSGAQAVNYGIRIMIITGG